MLNTTDKSSLPYREKVAWLSLVAMAVTLVPYLVFTSISPESPSLAVLAVALVTQALILGAGYLWLRLVNPSDARTPPDDLDRAIERRSLAAAYYLLIAGFVLVGCVLPFAKSGWAVLNAAVSAIVLAELVRNGVALWSYRKGQA